MIAARRFPIGALVAVLAAVIGFAGCGLGAGRTPRSIKLIVTRDFGRHPLHQTSAPKVSGQETIMSLLLRNYTVGTRYGGGFVESIDGLSGGEEAGHPVDWFYYVNGVEATKGAAATNVHAGDHIWWDRHDWSQTEDVPAVVGAFPQPFLNGIDGKRLPVRVECSEASGSACRTVIRRLGAAGVPAAVSAIAGGRTPETLRVLVGPWSTVNGDPAIHAIEQGPHASGVYARFSADGRTLTPLDQDGHTGSPLHADAGLIAATREGEDAPVWVVTGTNTVGVNRAAQAFDQATLEDRFAVALTPNGALPLPEATE